MSRSVRSLIIALAVCLLPFQAIGSVLMPLAGGQTEHADHGHHSAADLQHHDAYDGMPTGGDGHHGHDNCGVCHLSSAAALADPLVGNLFSGGRYDPLPPPRFADHIPPLPQRPPLS